MKDPFDNSLSERTVMLECNESYSMDMDISESSLGSMSLLEPKIQNEISDEWQQKNSPGRVWRVTVIESGISDNNNWYRPSVLKDAIPLFEGAPIRIYNYDGRRDPYSGRMSSIHHDHMPGWLAAKDAGSVTGNTVGALQDVKLEAVPSLRNPGQLVPALTATLVFVDPHTKTKISEAWNVGLMDTSNRALFELSIEAEGPHTRINQGNKDIKRVESITNVREVTIVSRGAAGGRFLQMIESQIFSESGTKKNKVEDLSTANPSEKKELEKDSVNYLKKDRENDEEEAEEDEDDLVPDEEASEKSRTSGQKAIKLLRGGNLELGIKVLEDIFTKDETEDENEDEKYSALKPNIDTQNHSKKLKRESLEKIDLVSSYLESYETVETELSEMGARTNEELIDDGSEFEGEEEMEYAESASVQQMQQELLNFSRFMAERDAEREARFMEALSQIQDNQSWRESQELEQSVRSCQRVLASCLRESGLPRSTQALIAEEYDGSVFMESDLRRTIDRHRNHLLKITEGIGSQGFSGESGRVMEAAGYNGGRISVGRNGFDWIQAEFDRAFGYDPAMDQSLTESERDTYRQLPANPSIRRPLSVWHDDPEFSGMGNVGPNALLREASSTSTGLAVILQNSMTKALLQQFAIQPAMWREVADTEPVANYLEQQRIVLGGLGRLPQVVESDSGSTYLRLGIPSSDQMKFTVGNYGGLICVTRQAIINDNLQVIQAYPQQAAEAAIMTLNLLIFGTAIGAYGTGSTPGVVNTAKSYTGDNIFHVNHNNYTTSALGYDSLVGALDRLSMQRKFGNVGYLQVDIAPADTTFTVSTAEFAEALKPGDSVKIEAEIVKVASKAGNVITITGSFASAHVAGPGTLRIEQLSNPIAFQRAILLVPTQLRAIAYTLLASALKPGATYTGYNDVSFIAPFFQNKELLPLAVHPMYLQDDPNNWYVMADKPVRVGFLGGREDPQLLLQDNPLVNNVFSGDLISWKVFHEYGCTLKGHLQVQGAVVAP